MPKPKRCLSHLCCLLCILSFLPIGNQAHAGPSSSLESLFYSLRWEQLASELETPQNGYQAYYQLNLSLYRYLATQDAQNLTSLQAIWKDGLALIGELPASDPVKLVLLAELHCKRAAMEFLEGNYLTAIHHARLGRANALKNQKKFPHNPEQLKVLGAFNVIFGAVPSRYQWITESLGFEGDIATGLEQLSRASRQGKLLRLESVLFASYAEKIMLNDAPAALNRLKGEKEAHGATYLLDYFLALAHLQTRQNEQAIAILNQSEQYESPGVFPLPYWNYQLGKAYYYRDQQREAQRYLARFLKAYRGNMYRTDAAFRLGVSLTLSGQYQQAKKIFAHITKGEESGFELDEYAAFMAGRFLSAKPSEAELALFRARNFYDGGYEMEAAEILGHLEKRQDLNEDETTELYYRWARLKHNQGQLVQAQQYYEKCGTTEATYQRWLQAYALYYLGEIAQSQEDWDTAKAYYQDVLGRDDYFYQAGLENRCKTRLSALEKRSDSR